MLRYDSGVASRALAPNCRPPFIRESRTHQLGFLESWQASPRLRPTYPRQNRHKAEEECCFKGVDLFLHQQGLDT